MMDFMFMEKGMQVISLVFSWLFWQATSMESQLVGEAVKYGFSVLFLVIAVIYIWKDWKREREENRILHKEMREIIGLYEKAMVSRDRQTERMFESISKRNETLTELVVTMKSHNDDAQDRFNVMGKTTDTINQTLTEFVIAMKNHNDQANDRFKSIARMTDNINYLIEKIDND